MGDKKKTIRLENFSQITKGAKLDLDPKSVSYSNVGAASCHIPTIYSLDGSDKGVKYTVPLPSADSSPYIAFANEKTGEISSLISRRSFLPHGLDKYKTEESKKGVKGFEQMATLEALERKICADFDNYALKRTCMVKAGVEISKVDPSKPFYDSGFFVKSVQQPTFSEYDSDQSNLGNPDYSKSPVMSINMWIGEKKADKKSENSSETKKPQTPTTANKNVMITNQNTIVYTEVVNNTFGYGNKKILKTWDDINNLLVYSKGDTERGLSFFSIKQTLELLAPTLFICKKEARLQWKAVRINVFYKRELVRNQGLTEEEDRAAYEEFLESTELEPEIREDAIKKSSAIEMMEDAPGQPPTENEELKSGDQIQRGIKRGRDEPSPTPSNDDKKIGNKRNHDDMTIGDNEHDDPNEDLKEPSNKKRKLGNLFPFFFKSYIR